MSKELETFSRIMKTYGETSSLEGTYDDFLAIKKALQRLEQIDNNIAICKKANEQKFVYIKDDYGIFKEKFLDDLEYEIFKNRLYVNSRGIYYNFSLNDYGNWWALTKEELENE